MSLQEDKKKGTRNWKGHITPAFRKEIKRRIINFLKTIKDSIMEIINTILLQVKGMPGNLTNP